MKKRLLSVMILVALCLSVCYVTVWANTSISIDKEIYEGGEMIVVTYSGVTETQKQAGAWVCVALVGAPPNKYQDWKYVEPGDGTVELLAPSTSGMYEVRFYKDKGIVIASLMTELSQPFKVGAEDGSLPYPDAESFKSDLIDFTVGNHTWTGTYESQLGLIALVQEGDSVTGSYSQWQNGKIEGKIQDGILYGHWYEEPSYMIPDDAGQIVLAMHEDGTGFTGWWRYSDGGSWGKWVKGTRIGLKTSDWAMYEVIKAVANEIVPDVLHDIDLTQMITRAEFAATAVRIYEKLSDNIVSVAGENPFTDTVDAEVQKAYQVGIIQGISETEFAPSMLLSREEATVMLTRAYKAAMLEGWSLEKDGESPLSYEKPGSFADDKNISDWAKESVYFMAANGVVNGIGDQLFAPKNVTVVQEEQQYANASREQAVIIANRLFEKFGAITVLPGGNIGGEKNIFLQQIPPCEVGTITETKTDESGASITIQGVTRADYYAYIEVVEQRFQNFINRLDENTGLFMIRSDGTYKITISFAKETMTINVETAE